MPHVTLDPTTFRASLARFASGVTVVTARDRDGHDFGMTVSAFSSLSLNPPMILVCIDTGASVAPVLEHCEHLAVNILADDQQALSQRFASGRSTASRASRCAAVRRAWPCSGAPSLRSSATW